MTRYLPSTYFLFRRIVAALSWGESRRRIAVGGACLVLCAGWGGRDAAAQMFSYSSDRARTVQSLSFGYTSVDFRFDGGGTPNPSFEFAGPLYGAVYTRPNFHVAFGYGSEDERDLRMLDASLTTWGEFRITGSPRSRLFVPVALHSQYRRVAPDGQEDSLVDAFNITVIGLGTGLGFVTQLTEALLIEGRAMPIIGLALRAFGDSAGSSRLVDTGINVHVPTLVGRVGFSAGYGFTAQVWNISASSLFPATQDDLFDYTSTSHSLSIGVNW